MKGRTGGMGKKNPTPGRVRGRKSKGLALVGRRALAYDDAKSREYESLEYECAGQISDGARGPCSNLSPPGGERQVRATPWQARRRQGIESRREGTTGG
jgi:hypothetical protein